MPTSERTRSVLSTIIAAALSCAAAGCTQIPGEIPLARVFDPSPRAGSYAVSSGRAGLPARSGRVGAPGSASDAGEAAGVGEVRRVGSRSPAAVRDRAGNGSEARRDEPGIVDVSRMSVRARRAKSGGAIDRRGRGGGARDVAVDARAPEAGGEVARLALTGSTGDDDTRRMERGEGGGRGAPGGVTDSPESSGSSSGGSTPPRTVVRGGQSGDRVSEMTRFARPDELEYLPGGAARAGDPLDLRTVFSDPALLLAPAPEPFGSWTRCGHGRF